MSYVAQKPISRYRLREREIPIPPRWQPALRKLHRPPLSHFVLLSVLLHALAVLLFGAPTGGAPDGRALWGPLRVELVGRVPEARPTADADRGLADRGGADQRPREAPAIFPQLLDRIVSVEPVRVPPLLVPAPTLLQGPATPPRGLAAPRVAIPEPVPRVETRPPEASLLPAPLLAPAPPVVAVPAPLDAPLAPPAPATAPQQAAPAIDPGMVREIARPDRLPTALERALTPPPRIEPAPAAQIEAAPVDARAGGAAGAATPIPSLAPSPFRAPAPGNLGRGEGSAYDPTAPATPSIDLAAVRRRAGEIARGTGNRALLPFPMPPVEAPKTRMEQVIEKARAPDCREAYKGLGLLALVPLIGNEFGDPKCSWNRGD